MIETYQRQRNASKETYLKQTNILVLKSNKGRYIGTYTTYTYIPMQVYNSKFWLRYQVSWTFYIKNPTLKKHASDAPIKG